MNGPRLRSAVKADEGVVKALIFAIMNEYDLEPAPKTADKDLDDLEGYYAGGLFDVLETEDGEIIGTVGLLPLEGGACELRKMYLRADCRGRSYGKRLLKHAVARAAELGFTRVELKTARALEEAIGLYEQFGFERAQGAAVDRRCDMALALDLAKAN